MTQFRTEPVDQQTLPKSRKPYLFVIQSGIITSAIALAGVYFLNKSTDDFNIMGFYANYVIPVGAIIVGLVAGSGYGVASWWTGAKIGKKLLLAVLVLQTLSYIAAEYVEYRDFAKVMEDEGLVDVETGKTPSFIRYYQIKAESFAWKSDKAKGEDGKPLGNWGYLFVGLGALGFIAGGVIVPAAMAAVPYCDDCQMYMKTRDMGTMPGSIAERKVKKSDTEGKAAYEAEQTRALEESDDRIKKVTDLATTGDGQGFATYVRSFAGQQKDINKLPRRVNVKMAHCTGCDKGHVAVSILTGKGDKVTTQKLPPVEVSKEFVRGVLTV